MGLSEAIAKVRKGAKKAGLDGALASLGAGLKSGAIPAPLRPAASRIASLIGGKAKREPRDLPTLTPSMPTSHGAHGANEVCPFTGLRADGTLEGTPAAEPAPSVVEAQAVEAKGPQVSVQEPVVEVVDSPVATEQAEVSEHAEASAPVVVEPQAEKPKAKPARAAKPAAKANVAKSTPPSAAREPSNEKSAPTEKGKEKVAGERSVAKNPARSANKPAAKQSNGKANQRKK